MSTQKKGWKDIPLGGACWMPSTEYKTGDWRSFKPVWNTCSVQTCNKTVEIGVLLTRFTHNNSIIWTNQKRRDIGFATIDIKVAVRD